MIVTLTYFLPYWVINFFIQIRIWLKNGVYVKLDSMFRSGSNGPNGLNKTEMDRSWPNGSNGPKYYTNIIQQKCNNNKYYTSSFKYYINIDFYLTLYPSIPPFDHFSLLGPRYMSESRKFWKHFATMLLFQLSRNACWPCAAKHCLAPFHMLLGVAYVALNFESHGSWLRNI